MRGTHRKKVGFGLHFFDTFSTPFLDKFGKTTYKHGTLQKRPFFWKRKVAYQTWGSVKIGFFGKTPIFDSRLVPKQVEIWHDFSRLKKKCRSAHFEKTHVFWPFFRPILAQNAAPPDFEKNAKIWHFFRLAHTSFALSHTPRKCVFCHFSIAGRYLPKPTKSYCELVRTKFHTF